MNDNICAVATPVGVGGVAVIRISGSSPLDIASKMFTAHSKVPVNAFEPYRMYPGEADAGDFKDYALCVYFKAPKSFTGEDVVEIHCHGGTAIINGILKRAVFLGCRMADRGEFTRRAFLNGKLSLSSCEGLIGMINSQSEAEVRASYSLYREQLNERTVKIQNVLTDMLAEIDAGIDFPEDGIEPYKAVQIQKKLDLCRQAVEKITDTYRTGSRIKHGISAAIVGRPNTGKSSLLNALIDTDKAIVSDIAGTTRDVVEGVFVINGVRFNLYDTAGIRESGDTLEKMGVERSKKMLKSADIVILVLDATMPLTQEDFDIEKEIGGKSKIVVYNKTDKKNIVQTGGVDLLISAKTGKNIDKLKDLLYEKTIDSTDMSGEMLIEERHYRAYNNALNSLENACAAAAEMPLDAVAIDIKTAWEYLGEISGLTAGEHIINEIFLRFCVGK